ncbi:MAG: ATP-binding protein [Gammaproteobacteria bacterium]|jgi:anti-sigma regulatory factor (Ser/Thr protein kinase)|nr:ATP-binding protein [Gammaproteobacteria bacterium]
MQLLERIHFLSRADKLKPVRDTVRALAQRMGCTAENIDCMVMAINEACMNVIQHAYGAREDGEVILEFWMDGEDMVVRVHDFANSVDRNNIKSRDLEDIRPGGLGVHLIHKMMDSVEYLDGMDGIGNMLQMRKRIV